MTGQGHNSGAGQLRAFVERIERLEADIHDLNADKSEVYKEAKGTGFNVKVLRKVIAARRMDGAERQEIDAIFDAYMTALGEAPEGLVRARVEPQGFAGDETPDHDAETGEIQDAPRPSINDEPSPEAGLQAEASLVGTDTGTLAGREGRREGEAASAGLPTIPDDFQPPAFLMKEAKPIRPHCLKPDLCAGYGAKHCHACRKARDDEVMAA